MRKFIRWVFWNVAYYVWPRPTKDFAVYLKRRDRRRWPWKKFRPSVYHNDDGNEWHVWLANERAYTVARQILAVELHIGMETGRVVGFDVFDEDLKGLEKEK